MRVRVRSHDARAVHHGGDRRGHVGVRAGGDGGERRAAERRRVGASRAFERHAGDVGVDLHPELRVGRAPGDGHGLGHVPGVRHAVEDEPRAERDALQNRAVHVRAAVFQSQTHQRASRVRIHVRRAVPLQVLLHDQALAPRRDTTCGFVHLVVETVVRLAAAQRLEPAHDRTGARLAALHDAGDAGQRVGVRAEHAGAADVSVSARDAEVQVRRARDERELPGPDHTQSDHGDERVRAALRDGQADGQAEVRGGGGGEPVADARAGRERRRRPLAGEVREIQLLEQRRRFGAVHEVPPHGDVVRARAVHARELQVEVVLVLADLRRRREERRLFLFQPQSLGDHPLRGDGAGAAAAHAQRGVARGQDLRETRACEEKASGGEWGGS